MFKSLFKSSDQDMEIYRLEAKVEMATSALEIMANFAKELADIDSKAGEESRSSCLYSMHKNAMDIVTRLKS